MHILRYHKHKFTRMLDFIEFLLINQTCNAPTNSKNKYPMMVLNTHVKKLEISFVGIAIFERNAFLGFFIKMKVHKNIQSQGNCKISQIHALRKQVPKKAFSENSQ
jgi:hypothetical protein